MSIHRVGNRSEKKILKYNRKLVFSFITYDILIIDKYSNNNNNNKIKNKSVVKASKQLY